MAKQVKEPATLQEAIVYFSNPENCLTYMIARRWPDGHVVCPRCGSDKVAFIPTRKLWECKSKHEKRQFSAKVGTVMEDSAIGLDKWLCAFWMVANCKNGVSSYEIHRTIGVTQKSAWFMLHRIRLALHNDPTVKASGEIEADETFVGGKVGNMHKSRKTRIQAVRSNIRNADAGGMVGKTAVMGILERETRQIRAKVVPNVRREVLQSEILKNVERGSSVYTDDAGGYRYLPVDQFVHAVVDHEKEYVNGRVHTNGMENFWSLLKRSLKGTYVAVEPFHLDRYVDEQVFRYNNRATKDNPLTDSDRFCLAVTQAVNKRLTFAELTGKDGKKPVF